VTTLDANDRPLRVLAQPAFKRRDFNPYNWQLSTSLQAAGVQVCEFSRDEALCGGHDIWHLHWPDTEAQFTRGDVHLIVRRSIRLLMLLRSARSRGTRVVWTVHNLRSHEQRFPRLEEWFWWLFVREVDGVISLSNRCLEAAIERFPRLARLPLFVVPHGHYRDSYPNKITRAEARLALGINQDARVLSFVGQIREYKNLPELITLVRALQDPTVTLLIAGRTTSSSLDERLQAAAGADPRVRLDLRLIPEHEIQVFLNAADVVVLPYREVLNSGAALLALSFNKPVLLPEVGALPELQERVGPAWVRIYRGALTTDILNGALGWARSTQRPAEAPLDPYDWSEVARQTIAAYHCVIAGRSPRRKQPIRSFSGEPSVPARVVTSLGNRARMTRIMSEDTRTVGP
jgi:beta-1,4-mannosyltransferase